MEKNPDSSQNLNANESVPTEEKPLSSKEEVDSESEDDEESAEEKETKARTLLKEKKYGAAADLFSQVLDMRTTPETQMADEFAELYFLYGKCLLFSIQTEMYVMGAVTKANMEKKLLGNKACAQVPSDNDPILGGDEEEEEEGDAPKDAAEASETAVEVLEVARLIYSRNPAKKAELAEVYLYIADLCMELENMQQAATDYEQCLNIRKQLYAPDNRKIAEVHYSLGLAHLYQQHMQDALQHFNSAKQILLGNVTKLKEELKNSADKEKADQLKDLEEIMSELDVKIEELTQGTVQINASELLGSSSVGFGTPSLPPNSTSQTNGVKVTELKGKRKIESVSTSEGSPAIVPAEKKT